MGPDCGYGSLGRRVIQSCCVSGGPPGGGAGPIIFLHQIPPRESRGGGGVDGPRVVAIGHLVGELRLSATGKEG